MKDGFEVSLLESGEIIKRSALSLVNNIGRAIAVITLVVSALVLFTDIGFSSLESRSFTSTMTVMLLASYLMYFSMEDAGEKLGEESAEYKNAAARCASLCELVGGDKIPSLRRFCIKYSEEEAQYRRSNLLLGLGYGGEEYEGYKNGAPCDKRALRAFRRADRIKPSPLTPKTLLSKERAREREELLNPESSKLLHMILRLIPTTLCMTVTVSVVLTAKDNLTAASIIDGIFKLSSLPIIGFKGYAAGYSYTKRTLPLWLETKARLLDAFLKSEVKN